MRIIALAAVLALAGSAAQAQSVGNPHLMTIQCIEVDGSSIPPLCRVPGSRLDKSEDICTCPAGGQRIDVPVCKKGETAPPEGVALYRVRREALKSGTLAGMSFKGKPICAPEREP